MRSIDLASVSRTIARDVASRARRPGGRRRFVEAVRAEQTVRVNVGCGRLPIDGWINTDVHWRSRHHLDLTEPWPTGSASIDLVMADNVIEHMTLEDGRLFLRHAFEALRPGGAIRIATPDVRRAAEAYLRDDLPHELAGLPTEHPVDILRNVFVRHEHWRGYCYDVAALTAEMAAAGFKVEECEAGISSREGLAQELRVSPAEAAHQLILEGTKPAIGVDVRRQ